MKVRGRIETEDVVVLIVTALYGVLVAGGVSVKGRWVIHNVELEMQDCTIVTSFLSVELGIADVILDVQWLDTLGEMHVNWKQVMKIRLGEKNLTVVGDKSLHSEEVSLKALQKGWAKDGEGMIVELTECQSAVMESEIEVSMKWARVIDR